MTIVQDFLAKCQEHELPLTPHFVRCKADKKAVDGHWQARPANTRAAADWLDTPGNLLGIIPASIGCVVVDVDQGGDEAVTQLAELLGPALAVIPSQSPDKYHVWYSLEGDGVNNREWQLPGDPAATRRGDIRSNRGYVILWHSETVAAFIPQIADAKAITPEHLNKLPKPKRETKARPSGSMAAAPAGGRNELLNKLAFAAGKAGNLQRKETLRQEARESGLPAGEVESTLESGFAAGSKEREAGGKVFGVTIADFQALLGHLGLQLRQNTRAGTYEAIWPNKGIHKWADLSKELESYLQTTVAESYQTQTANGDLKPWRLSEKRWQDLINSVFPPAAS